MATGAHPRAAAGPCCADRPGHPKPVLPGAGGDSGMHWKGISRALPADLADRDGKSGGPYGVTSTSK